MTEAEARNCIDDIIHTLRIMRKTAVDQEKLTNYICALELAYAKLAPIKQPQTAVQFPGQVDIEDYIKEIGG